MPPRQPAITEDVTAIEGASRAIVYLSVDWSVPELDSRRIVSDAIAALPDSLGASFFTVQEDAPKVAAWLSAHGWFHHPIGSGSVLWFEHGRRVESELLPARIGSEGIVAKTMSLWDIPAA